MLPMLMRAARGDAGARTELAEHLRAADDPSASLVELALEHFGSREAREAIQTHQADPRWSSAIPLHQQEYPVIFRTDARFHLRYTQALAESGWAAAHLQALSQPAFAGRAAARHLLAELHLLAEQAADFTRIARQMRQMVDSMMHLLRVQALLRMEWVLGRVAGKRILEVGTQDGGLLLHLEKLGADVSAVDLGPELVHPRIQKGDFMKTELPGPYDVIVATSVFEKFSAARGEDEPELANTRPELLERFRQLTQPGSLIILENIMFPPPFTAADAREAGFEVLPMTIPSANFRLGGRGCTLRRMADSD